MTGEDYMNNKRKRKFILLFAIIGFLITLYLTEMPPYGSEVVAEHNHGFGTFDMETYDSQTVEQVLSETDEGGWVIYNRYYVCDFAFILFFGLLQMMISLLLYDQGNQYLKMLAVGIPVLRGLLDAIENIMLLYIINDYPTLHSSLVNLSHYITTVKFAVVPVWIVLVMIGIFMTRKRYKEKID